MRCTGVARMARAAPTKPSCSSTTSTMLTARSMSRGRGNESGATAENDSVMRERAVIRRKASALESGTKVGQEKSQK